MKFNLQTLAVKNVALKLGRVAILLSALFVFMLGASHVNALDVGFDPCLPDGVCTDGEAFACPVNCPLTNDCGACIPTVTPTGAVCTSLNTCIADIVGSDNCTPGPIGGPVGTCVWTPPGGPAITGATCTALNTCMPNPLGTDSCSLITGTCVWTPPPPPPTGGGTGGFCTPWQTCSFTGAGDFTRPCADTPECVTTCNLANDACIVGGGGAPCNSVFDCVIGPDQSGFCNGPFCSRTGPGGGGSCNAYTDCLPQTGTYCTISGDCIIGGSVNNCSSPADCLLPSSCFPASPCSNDNTCSNCIPPTPGPLPTPGPNSNLPPGCSGQGQCTYGGGSVYCTGRPDDCQKPLGCTTVGSLGQCKYGGTEGACSTNFDCLQPLGCNSQQQCVRGGTEGSCSINANCVPAPRCNEITRKCVPGGTGSVCSNEAECQVTKCTTQAPYQCVPVTQGGNGRFCSLDSSNPDKVCQPPPDEGTLVIRKVATGGTGDRFQFYGNPLPLAFNLGAGESVSLQVEPGTKEDPIRYNIAEILPQGWNFTGAFCDRSFILTTNSVEEVSVESNETTTCTFFNEKNGAIKIINKNDSYPGEQEETAEYAIFPTPIYETITAIGGTGVGMTHELRPATYTIFQNTPMNWRLVDVTCNGVPTAVVNGFITVTVKPGETTECTFKKKLLEGNLIINKFSSGGNGTFEFNITRTGQNGGVSQEESITTVNGRKDLPLKLIPGTYNISEIIPDGWKLTNFNCTNTTYDVAQNGVTNVVIVDGKTAKCNFYNSKTAILEIIKETNGDDGTFNFNIDFDSPGQANGQAPITPNATVTTAGNVGRSDLLPESGGTYNVTEMVPDDWKFDVATCVNGNFITIANGVSVTLTNGQKTTCTFKNAKKGKANLKIVKETVGGDDTFNYKIENYSPGQNNGEAPLVANANVKTTDNKGDSGLLGENQGEYNITEVLGDPSDWRFDFVSCVKEDGSPTGTFGIGSTTIANVKVTDNETTTCTFKNTKKATGKLKIIKETEGQKNSTETFYFNINLSNTNAQGNNSAVTPKAEVNTNTIGASTNGRGETAELPQNPGNYNIAEDTSKLPDGWSFQGATCDHTFTTAPNGVISVSIVNNETTICTFKNSKNGFLVINKKTGTQGDATFKFNVNPTPSVITVTTRDGNGTNNGKCPDGNNPSSDGKCQKDVPSNSPILELKSGAYLISERPATAWSLSKVECKKENQETTGMDDPKTVSIKDVIIEAGKTTTCEFVNVKNSASGSGGGGGFKQDIDGLDKLPEYDSPY